MLIFDIDIDAGCRLQAVAGTYIKRFYFDCKYSQFANINYLLITHKYHNENIPCLMLNNIPHCESDECGCDDTNWISGLTRSIASSILLQFAVRIVFCSIGRLERMWNIRQQLLPFPSVNSISVVISA